MNQRWAAIGATLMAIAVASGAFAAHALKTRLMPDKLIIFEKAVFYNFVHGIAILLVCLFALTGLFNENQNRILGIVFLGGTLLFSGSLYLYSILETRWLVILTPIGGSMFIIGWLLFAFYSLTSTK